MTLVEPVSPELLEAQLATLAQDMPPAAIKTGLLGSVANVRVVCAWVDRLREAARAQGRGVALVVDPVLGATTGAAFASAEVLQAYVDELLPRATLITPNRAEALRLLGQEGCPIPRQHNACHANRRGRCRCLGPALSRTQHGHHRWRRVGPRRQLGARSRSAIGGIGRAG